MLHGGKKCRLAGRRAARWQESRKTGQSRQCAEEKVRQQLPMPSTMLKKCDEGTNPPPVSSK